MTDRHLWADDYDRDLGNVLTLQNDVARAIARQVCANVSPEDRARLAIARRVNTQAYQAYLKGQFFLNKWSDEGFAKAKEYFQQSIDLDKTYAPAYLGLGEYYGIMAFNGKMPRPEGYLKAESLTIKALEIDETFAEAHASLGLIKLQFSCDRSGTEKELNRAIQLNPGDMATLDWHSYYLLEIRRINEAIAEKKEVLEHDPLSVITSSELGFYFQAAGRTDEAIQQQQKALELDPNYSAAHARLADLLSGKKEYEQASVELRKAIALDKGPEKVGLLGDVYARWGKSREADEVIEELKQMSKQRYVSPTLVARIYARLGEKDRALMWLGKAQRGDDPTISDPGFDSLRSDTRIRVLEARLKPNESCPPF
jgi:tetratricopeptide (TPR) repeat protein